jgi:MATE family multidrug resistance protein
MRSLVALTVPIVAGFAGSTPITVVDTVMIAPLRTVPLGAAWLATSGLILFHSAIYGLLTASGIRIAEHVGAGGPVGVRGALRAGLLLALITGSIRGSIGASAMDLLFWLLPVVGTPQAFITEVGSYWMLMAATLLPWSMSIVLIGTLIAEGRPWPGFLVGALQLMANVSVNWALIHAAGLGLTGAGLASLLATVLSLPVAWLLLSQSTRQRPVPPAPLCPEMAVQWCVGWRLEWPKAAAVLWSG